MSNRNLNSGHGAIRQRGTVLVIALLVLIVMTILGITAMNSSILQSFMSAGYQAQTTTLAAAENVLRAGENDVETIMISGIGGRNYYSSFDPGDTAFAAGNLNTTWLNPFVIERIRGPRDDGGFPILGESVAVGGGLEDSSLCLFRVSARGTGDRGGLRIVQSTYVTLGCPSE